MIEWLFSPYMREWFFRPCIKEYRGNWQDGYSNRCWYYFVVIANPLTIAIAALLMTKIGYMPVLVLSIASMINILQQFIFEMLWKREE